MKVCFETFGCRLNKAEALQMEAEYLARGWELTTRHADAHLIIVRGCSVTSRAQADCERLIAHLRHRYPHVPIRVCGCLQRKTNASEAKTPAAPKSAAPRASRAATATPLALPTRTARAYLKVQDGCAGRCTFCIVPKFRGESRSEDFASLLGRARQFIDAGYHEIVVTGCNLALYASEGKRLPDLVSALADLDAGCRIRLGSVEPGACAQETIRAMAEKTNVCRFLHLPIQSGADKVLFAMRRPYAVKDVEQTVKLATELMPGLGLGCDLMTGFPGESELEFASTQALLRRLPFSNAHIFPFSARPETVAAGLPSQNSRTLRVIRAHELSKIVEKKRQAFAHSFFGKTVEIVVEDEKTGRGWTGEYLPCEPTAGRFTRKSTLRLLVTKTADGLLQGRPLK